MLQYQISFFKRITHHAKTLPKEERLKLFENVLDLPGIDIDKLFMNPKAKLLLAPIPELQQVFTDIANDAYEIFWQKEELEQQGLVFKARSSANRS